MQLIIYHWQSIKKIAGPLAWISVRGMFIYNLPYKIKNPHILTHNPLFALFIFGRTKLLETIVTTVYKQGHLVLGFQHSYLSQVCSFLDFLLGPLLLDSTCIDKKGIHYIISVIMLIVDCGSS